MLSELDNFYFKQREPLQSGLLALRDILLTMDNHITHRQRFQVPFFYYKEWRIAFLWVVKQKEIMLGILTDNRVNPPGKRKREDDTDIIMLNPDEDFPIDIIREKINDRIRFYDSLGFQPEV